MLLNLMDRVLIRSFFKGYLFCLTSLLSLYIVVDLFTNADDFAHNSQGFLDMVGRAGAYYGYRVFQIFDRLCEATILLAAMFTVAWVQRNNELLPMLSAGVSTRRMIRPVLVCACAMLFLATLNQELIIPRIAPALDLPRDDPEGANPIFVSGTYDTNNVHIEGTQAWRNTLTVKPFHVAIPETIASSLIHITATEARYIPPGNGPRSGGWLLLGCNQPPELEHFHDPAVLEFIDPGKYFLRVQRATFDAMTRNNTKWFTLISTRSLRQELERPDSQRLSAMAVLFHLRLTRPIIGMLLVFLGLSIILRDQNRNVFISAGLCLIVCTIFFGTCITCKYLGDNGLLWPALAAWIPVLIFGPTVFVLFDAIHT